MMDTADQLTVRLTEISRFHDAIINSLGTYIVGNQNLLELVLIALLSEGHILIEGVPGTAKTTIAKAVARATNCHVRPYPGCRRSPAC